MGKIIGLTFDLKTDWISGPNDPVDMNAEYDSPKTIDKIAAALEKGGHTVKRIGGTRHLLKQIDHLGVDIVFNIAEGFGGRNRESQVPLILEMNKIPYVGSDALTLGVTLDKVLAKKCFIADGISTPRYFVARANDDLQKLNTIGFPLIVKTRWEGTSKGLTDQSRVDDLMNLRRQVKIINERYHQTALVEEFIKGQEFTVAVIGNDPPQAMPVAQVVIDGNVHLGDQFFTFERVSYGGLRYACPAKISVALTKRLQELAVAAYQSVDCLDFGRVDFRVDEQGTPYVLEINPLPSLAENDVFNIFPTVVGSDYNKTVNQVLNFALRRYGLAESLSRENHPCAVK